MESNKELKQRNLYEFLKYLTIGFTIVSFFISVAVIGFVWVSTKNQKNDQIPKITVTPTISLLPSPTD